MHIIARTTTESNAPASTEAPCSINARIDVDGLSVQVTGRGTTPDEAVANFRGTVTALRTQSAPAPTPLSREAQVAQLLACGLAKAAAAADWSLVDRLAKAASLVLAHHVELGNRAGMLAVRSMAHPDTWYEVDGKACTCPDAQHHPDRLCEHALAAAMWQRLI